MKTLEEIRALRPDQRTLEEAKVLAVTNKISKDLDEVMERNVIGGMWSPDCMVGMDVPGPNGVIGKIVAVEQRADGIYCQTEFPINNVTFKLVVDDGNV
jgi:hypothetical protein